MRQVPGRSLGIVLSGVSGFAGHAQAVASGRVQLAAGITESASIKDTAGYRSNPPVARRRLAMGDHRRGAARR